MNQLINGVTSENCTAMMLMAFAPFHVVNAVIEPGVSISGQAVGNAMSYRMKILTKQAPYSLLRPAYCSGGMQFSYVKKRFVYRFDNMVLAFSTVVDDENKSMWLAKGRLYVTSSENAAFDLVNQLIQVLSRTIKCDQASFLLPKLGATNEKKMAISLDAGGQS